MVYYKYIKQFEPYGPLLCTKNRRKKYFWKLIQCFDNDIQEAKLDYFDSYTKVVCYYIYMCIIHIYIYITDWKLKILKWIIKDQCRQDCMLRTVVGDCTCWPAFLPNRKNLRVCDFIEHAKCVAPLLGMVL